jgi:hypothetical protein
MVKEPESRTQEKLRRGGGADAAPRTEGRCIPRPQIYRMSTQIPRPRDWYGVR